MTWNNFWLSFIIKTYYEIQIYVCTRHHSEHIKIHVRLLTHDSIYYFMQLGREHWFRVESEQNDRQRAEKEEKEEKKM